MGAELHQGPLNGLRVIDLATVFAGPSAARRLADFGAEVIKVERVGDGDGARTLGEQDGADGYYWRQIGRNKRPIELDLKTAGGKEVLLRLVRSADVLIENFRPGALERLGLDPETVLLQEQPGLVVLRVTGFGQDGPYSSRAGFGTIAEAMSTLAYTTGQPDGPPTLPPIALADEITGALSAFAVLAAIRHRDLTGEGQVIDATLLESMLDVVGPGAAITHRTGVSDQRIGSRLWFSAPRNVYRCKDGKYVGLVASIQKMAERLLRAIGRPDLVVDPRFRTNSARVKNAGELDNIIGAFIAARTQAENVEFFDRADVTVGPIYDVSQIVEDPHVIERELVADYPDEDMGEYPMYHVVPRMSATPGSIRTTAPKLGAHNRELLREVGIDDAAYAKLVSGKIIGDGEASKTGGPLGNKFFLLNLGGFRG